VTVKVLDLFCGEGGAAMGYASLGFDVFGVDTDAARLRRYPFPHVKADAVDFLSERGHHFDLIHASPPCQGYSVATSALSDRSVRYERLIPAVRELLAASGRPYVLENVIGARSELVDPVQL